MAQAGGGDYRWADSARLLQPFATADDVCMGYVGDLAVVRVWRKDDSQQHSTQLVTLSNALQDDNLWPVVTGWKLATCLYITS
ncbi:MAG: hypothetical protein ACSLEN_06110 [Candidatus Malihini olakiniferum]